MHFKFEEVDQNLKNFLDQKLEQNLISCVLDVLHDCPTYENIVRLSYGTVMAWVQPQCSLSA